MCLLLLFCTIYVVLHGFSEEEKLKRERQISRWNKTIDDSEERRRRWDADRLKKEEWNKRFYGPGGKRK